MNDNIPLPCTVVFDIWGQRSRTVFEVDSASNPQRWILACYNNGFMRPVEILAHDGSVLADQAAILAWLEGE